MEILDHAKLKHSLHVVLVTVVVDGEVESTYAGSAWLTEAEAMSAINHEIKAFTRSLEPVTPFYCEQNLPDKAVVKIGNRTVFFTVSKIDSFVRRYKIGSTLVEHV